MRPDVLALFMAGAPKILIFDSGLGGLTVYAEAARLIRGAHFVYAADDAAFPYGELGEDALVARVLTVIERLSALFAPDAIVIACNTASTVTLPHLRARFPGTPFVGTVPAIKPAASLSRSGLISVLATPGTVARDYTRDLVRAYAANCSVTLTGSARLAPLAEAFMHGHAVQDAAVLAEIMPAFRTEGGRRTDCIVLACTHYPLLLGHFERLAPWPVSWIDPAPAIARRTAQVLREQLGLFPPKEPPAVPDVAVFTGAAAPPRELIETLRRRGIGKVAPVPMPREGIAGGGKALCQAQIR